MKKEVIAITILVLLYGGIFTLNSQLTLAKDESSDKECAAKKTISNTLDPTIQKVTPIAKTEGNSLTTISTQADNINDNTLLIQLNNSAQSELYH
jgi:hypothetical protein